MAGRWVCLDVGETLIDETRIWSTWADVLGIPRFTFMAAFGAVLARGGDHRAVFDLVGRPNWRDRQAEFNATYGTFEAHDLYPDALGSLDALQRAGYRVAILANQPGTRTEELHTVGVQAEIMAMSDELGLHKPDPAFFSRAIELMAAKPADVAYVGDRLDNDVSPAATAGMRPVWIRRGPWAYIQNTGVPPGTLEVDSLTELVEQIATWWP